MRIVDVESPPGTDAFHVRLRQERWIATMLALSAIGLWGYTAYLISTDSTDEAIEMMILTVPLTILTPLAYALAGLLGFDDIDVLVTSSTISLEHERKTFGWDQEIEVSRGKPKVEEHIRESGTGSNKKTYKDYTITYKGTQLLKGVRGRGNAVEFADRLNLAIERSRRGVQDAVAPGERHKNAR